MSFTHAVAMTAVAVVGILVAFVLLHAVIGIIWFFVKIIAIIAVVAGVFWAVSRLKR